MISLRFDALRRADLSIEISVDTVPDRFRPNLSELRRARAGGYISQSDVVEFALRQYGSTNQPSILNQIALLLSDEVNRVDELLFDGETSDDAADESEKIWLFLFLREIDLHPSRWSEPLVAIELVSDEFGNPDETQSLIYYASPTSDEGELGNIMERLHRYVEARDAYYSRRD
ncbi:DUF2247 family protein [Agreia sp. Leaf283]|uniref:DUF2247 family protein n=1 Tax=Agreia sp. Leaf283 TaxID=1736321 RepID=UPI0012F8F387|nr:DUF2247 family protein [Agreia sp. Leaf283]